MPGKTRWFTIVAILLAGLCFSCKTQVTVSESTSSSTGPETILVLPFKNMATVYGNDAHVRSPMSGKVFITGSVMEDAGTLLRLHLIDRLKAQSAFQVVASGQGEGVLATIDAGYEPGLGEREIAMRVGSALDIDYVVTGYIYRFRDRVGSDYSVDSPASVAFEVCLVRVADGLLRWSGHLDETQKALSDDLLQIGKFFKRKASWITAEEMAVSGLNDMLRTFP